MARQTGTVTWNTLAAFKANTSIEQQESDEVQIKDVLSEGVTHIARNAGTETVDDVYTIRKTNDATKTFWASSVNKLVAGNVAVAYSALPDGVEDVITVAVPGLAVGSPYDIGVISGLPAGCSVVMERVTTANSMTIRISNNTGVSQAAGTLQVNVYSLK